MSVPRNRFRDPTNVLPEYLWHVNHNEESEVTRGRQVTTTAPTSGIGHIIQQGEQSPLTLSLSGTALQDEQITWMRLYADACETRTIQFWACNGDRYEVLITRFSPTRKRTARNQRTGGLHYWTYQLDMQVIRVLAGVWIGTPA